MAPAMSLAAAAPRSVEVASGALRLCARSCVSFTAGFFTTFIPVVDESFISADVLLDDFGRPGVRLGRIAAGFAQRAPLAQQVPALIQFDLNVGETLAASRIEGFLPEEPVLLGHQALNMGEHGCVLAMFFHGRPRWLLMG